MNNNNLLDYTETYPEPFDASDLPAPIRLLTGLYLVMWGINLVSIVLPEFNELLYEYNLFTILYLIMAGCVFWSWRSERQLKDVWSHRYRTGVMIGIVLIVLYQFTSPLYGYGAMISLVFSMGYYLAFTGAGVWLIRSWRLREQAGRWWILWEQWSWFWAIGNLINNLTFTLRYSMGWEESNDRFWAFVDWGLYGGILLLALYRLMRYLSGSTNKERYVGGLSWLAFGGLLIISNNIIEESYVTSIVGILGVGLVLWTGYIVLKSPDNIHIETLDNKRVDS